MANSTGTKPQQEAVEKTTTIDLAEEDFLRAQFYAYLAQLLSGPPTSDVLANTKIMEGDPSPMGKALSNMAAAATKSTQEAIEDEFSKLFYGMGQGGEVLPYASYYISGSLYDEALAVLRHDMERIGIANAGKSKEPEDHIAFILEIMHGLIIGRFGDASNIEKQRHFFDTHLATWAEKLFKDLESAESSIFYMTVARVGLLFIQIESEAFKMAA